MTGLDEPNTAAMLPMPMRRTVMLLQAARILLASFAGWAAGAILIRQFGTGSLAADLGLIVLAAFLWAGIPLTLLRVLRRRVGAPRSERPRTWGIWFVIAGLTGSALIGIVRPVTEDWSTLQIWSAIFLFTPLGIALETAPRLIRPAGWTSMAASTSKTIPLALLGGSLVAFGIAAALGDGVLRAGRLSALDEAPLSLVGLDVAVVAAVLSLAVVLAFAVGLPLLAHGGIGLLYAGFSILVQFAWLPVMGGLVRVDGTALLALHLIAALALVIATAVVQVFRPAGPSAAEIALVDWLRAEAVLPEKPAVEGKAAG